ncbi:hypothetical protein EW145_g2227 [Phellinidium pouzarii]|uniref:Protein kinase domain-containing protein n=1 Tax=Phellinidium pouzarii TaxID=167371 RepID=A0A4S4LDI0_9AGAM|nr:hypothetical protein EW145_g2227 [Phellinidium pouzarii]
MSATVHTPSRSPSKSDLFAFRSYRQTNPDSSFTNSLSPSRQASATPPRRQPVLMLTPSPLRRRLDFNDDDLDAAMQLDFDDFSAATGFSTPFHPSTRQASVQQPRFRTQNNPPTFRRPPKPPLDDDEGLFLRSNVGHTSLPLRTPDRLSFDLTDLADSGSNLSFSHAPKRKINHMSSSPNVKHGLTPLRIHQASDEDGTKSFATLAPLQAPRFLRNRGSAGNNIGGQADSLKQMRISDRSIDLESDSDSEEEFSSLRARRNISRLARPLGDAQEVIESVSPDGHVSKRRARSRPVSLELMASYTAGISPKLPLRNQTRAGHRRNGSNTSVSESGSPIKLSKVEKSKPEFNRMASSATLFFGPAIVNSSSNLRKGGPGNAHAGFDRSSHALPPSTPAKSVEISKDDDLFSPISPISPDSSFTSAFPKPADTSLSFAFSITGESPSPRSRIPTKFKKPRDSGVVLSDDEADDLLQPVSPQSTSTRPDALTRLHARASTYPQPSTSYSTSSEATLLDDSLFTPSSDHSRDSAWPDSTLDVSLVDEFIVKTLEAGTKDGGGAEKRVPSTPQKRTKTAFLGMPIQRPWASAVPNKMTRLSLFDEKLPGPNFGTIIDSGGSAGDLSVPRRVLDTNVNSRKSCPGDLKFPSVDSESMCTKSSGFVSEVDTSPSCTHLIHSRHRTYGDVGLGRPSGKLNASQLLIRRSSSGAFSTMSDASDSSNFGTPTRKKNEFRVPMLPLGSQYTPSNNTSQLMPLSSNPSPVFNEPSGPRYSVHNQLPFFGKLAKENRRPESLRINSRVGISENISSQRFSVQLPNGKGRRHRQQSDGHEAFLNHHLIPPQPHDQPGRFEREFVEVDKIGSGEFGSATKVRHKDNHGWEDRVYAVKKSKRFEGNRHHSRLREEVEVLQHLSSFVGPGFHPNVLGYVDSWEQDNQLYILTELCEYGNFAHFLSEYGHHFARLEEARVWKIFADISSGLRFIHQNNVVHFDLKPANIFITAAGRFKIGDFGMASVWPRQARLDEGSADTGRNNGFEREGDKMYLAAEVLQGRYGKETDIFSFGMMMLETATNIVVPTQGELWHKLREEDFSPVDGFDECSNMLVQLITSMLRKDPGARPSAESVYAHPVVTRARARMEEALVALRADGETRPEVLFKISPLSGVDASFLTDILCVGTNGDLSMDCSA